MSDYVDLPVNDRMKSFLFNEEMADVHFLVGTDGVKERIPAYKILLATASEVFHGQLYGRFDVPETIDVTDTTPETFKTVLRFWDTIDLHAGVVLRSPEFLELSHDNLCGILRRDLNAAELTVYNGAETWAQAECARMQVPFESHARALLGDALKLIRFPLMSIGEFCSGPAMSNLLSDQEKLEMCSWFGPHASHEMTSFSSTPRKRLLLSCNRFSAASVVNYNGGNWPNTRDYRNFFTFSVSTRVRFHGLAFFGRKDESKVYDVDFSIRNATSGGAPLANAHSKITTEASEDTYKVLFDRPVLMEPGIKYRVSAVSIGPKSLYAENGPSEVTCDSGGRSVVFSFKDTGLRECHHYDASLMVHIPTVYFSFT